MAMSSTWSFVLKIAVALVLVGGLASVVTFVVVKYRQEAKPHFEPQGNISRPHIIVFLADDLGYDDVSFHGNEQIPTPNLDAMAADGVILNRHYAAMSGTPSRGALFTAKLPLRIGLNEAPVLNGVYGSGLSLKHKLLPSFMRDLGYETHLIGRWSLGFYKESLLPTNRGFDTHYGPYSDTGTYFSHLLQEKKWAPFNVPPGYDLHLNGKPDFTGFGTYITDLYNQRFRSVVENREKPLFIVISHMAPHGASSGPLYQLPAQLAADSKVDNRTDKNRRKYAALVKTLDNAFGQTVEVLHRNGILSESVILFSSDNGGPTFKDPEFATGASNWPLRGQKNTQWEGGVRVASFIWSSLISEPYVSGKIYHFVDWLPTFYHLAGGKASDIQDIDGMNVWDSIANRSTASPRTNILLVYDRENTDNSPGFAAIMGKYKYVSGRWKDRAQTQHYLPMGYSVTRDFAKLEKLRQESIVSKMLGDIGRPNQTPNETWRDEARIRCSWGSHLRCNYMDCDKLMQQILAGTSNNTEIKVEPLNASHECDFKHKSCLFDLESDPCETSNLGLQMPQVLEEIESYIMNNFDPVESTAKLGYDECYDRDSNPANYDPPVWKPWHHTCDKHLDEVCAKPLPAADNDAYCPPGGNVMQK